MGRMKKELEWRLQGMIYAHKIVKERSLEDLEKEIKGRGRMKIDVWADKKEVDQLYQTLSTNLYQNMLAAVMYSIHNVFGFGGERLKRLKAEFDKNVVNLMGLDWTGEHYITFADWAKELDDKYGLGLNVDQMEELQKDVDAANGMYKRLDADSLLEALRDAGYMDAAAFIESKI